MKTLGRFEILEQIGAGGMGVVYKARDPHLARTVALKVLTADLSRDRGARERLLHEARAAASLTHPHIATVHEIVAAGDAYAIVMECVDGELLYTRVRRGLPEIERALTWAREMADGLAAAHAAHVIHRDIKSHNIMLTREERVKILDFGLAHRILAPAGAVEAATQVTPMSHLVGTIGYIAPEILSGEEATPQSDVFSLGVVLFETFTGRPPFESSAPVQVMYQVVNREAPALRSIRPEAPEAVDAVIRRAMAKEPGARYADAGELYRDLQAIRLDDPGGARAPREEPPWNLPAATTRFIGRVRELEDLTHRLGENRLITITGPGGAGKTRVSQELARRVRSEFPGGIYLIELAPVEESGRLTISMARALGLREDPEEPLLETIARHLAEKTVLLLFDNCEHLINAVAGAVVHLVQAAPGLKVVATSQERLGVPGEVVWQIPSLSLPDPRVVAPRELARYEAVRLFVDRATLVKSGFALDERNAAAVVQICRQLDGIPLALELAAARIRMLTPERLLERLEDRFRFLTDGNRTSLPRQQTLRATVAWSVDLLTEVERRLFASLCVFSGGMSLEAVEGVCAGSVAEEELIDVLGRLLDKSLIQARETDSGELRYRMLETLRAYGRELLQKSGEYRSLHDRHAAYYLELIETAEAELAGPNQVAWLDRLELEADNGRAMLGWFHKTGDFERALRVGAAIWRFWLIRGYLRTGRELLAQSLAETSEPTATRARALLGAGVLATDQGDYDAAREHFEECLAIRRELGDRPGLPQVLNMLGIAARDQGDYEEAQRLLSEGLEISRELKDQAGVAAALTALGITAHRRGDCEGARARFEEARSIRTKACDQRGIAALHAHLGGVAFDLGEIDAAEKQLGRALLMFQELGNKRGIVFARMYLGGVAQARGHLDTAQERFVDCLRTSRELGDKQHIVRSLEWLAGLAAARGKYDRALELDGAALALRETFGAPRTPLERRLLEEALRPAEPLLHESGMRRLRTAGRSRLLDAAIELALEEAPGPDPAP